MVCLFLAEVDYVAGEVNRVRRFKPFTNMEVNADILFMICEQKRLWGVGASKVDYRPVMRDDRCKGAVDLNKPQECGVDIAVLFHHDALDLVGRQHVIKRVDLIIHCRYPYALPAAQQHDVHSRPT